MPPQLTEAEKLAAAKELQREFSKGGKSKRYHGETSLPQSRVMSRGLLRECLANSLLSC
jgi:hypothetical protein